MKGRHEGSRPKEEAQWEASDVEEPIPKTLDLLKFTFKPDET